jgi:hypothetical protein
MSLVTSAMLQYPCKTTVENRVGPEVNGFASSRARCLVFKFMDLFDIALQVHGPMAYLTLVVLLSARFLIQQTDEKFWVNHLHIWNNLECYSLTVFGVITKYKTAYNDCRRPRA